MYYKLKIVADKFHKPEAIMCYRKAFSFLNIVEARDIIFKSKEYLLSPFNTNIGEEYFTRYEEVDRLKKAFGDWVEIEYIEDETPDPLLLFTDLAKSRVKEQEALTAWHDKLSDKDKEMLDRWVNFHSGVAVC